MNGYQSSRPESASPIAIRIAREQDSEFFYLGYNPFPGKEAIRRSLANGRGYKPNTIHSNDDDSVTVEWPQRNFGFHPKERRQNFYKYAADIVIPQLEDVVTAEVDFNDDLSVVLLQRTKIADRAKIEEGFNVTRHKVGSMTLFSLGEAALAGATEQSQVT